MTSNASIVEPFTISVADEVIDDMRHRLRRTRWPRTSEGEEWEWGVDLAYFREICAYWEREYDWREQEALLNQLPQYTAEVDGSVGLASPPARPVLRHAHALARGPGSRSPIGVAEGIGADSVTTEP